MGKIVFWLVVVFAVLFVLRLVNASKARQRRDAGRGHAPAGMPMVQCRDCGVYLPKTEAMPAGGAFRCPEGTCGRRR